MDENASKTPTTGVERATLDKERASLRKQLADVLNPGARADASKDFTRASADLKYETESARRKAEGSGATAFGQDRTGQGVALRAKSGDRIDGGRGRRHTPRFRKCWTTTRRRIRVAQAAATAAAASRDDLKAALKNPDGSNSSIYSTFIGKADTGSTMSHGDYLPPCVSCDPMLHLLEVDVVR
jgi:hypothetical protein